MLTFFSHSFIVSIISSKRSFSLTFSPGLALSMIYYALGQNYIGENQFFSNLFKGFHFGFGRQGDRF